MATFRTGHAAVEAATTPEEALTPPIPADVKTGELMATPPPYLRHLPIITDMTANIEASIARIMNAETPEEALADPESAGLRDYSGKVITITSVTGILPSTLRTDEYYIAFEAQTKVNGAPELLTTGSPYAGARIAKLAKEGWLPRRVRVVELASASNPSQSSLWIVDAPGGSEAYADDEPY